MIIARPPEQCSARKRPSLADRWWAWVWQQPLDSIVRCQYHEGHARDNPDRADLQFHYSGLGQRFLQ